MPQFQFLSRTIRAGLAALLAAGACAAAQAAGYPDKPVHLIVPFGPGSVTDQLARITADKLGKALGQTVIVENKAGAGGNIGAGYVAGAPADGYTLLLGPASTNAINPSLYHDLKFDPMKDFAPITNVASVTNVLVVPAAVPVHTVRELIDQLKQHSGAYSYASGGAGGSQHLSAELFKTMSGTQMLHVPYKGGGAALADLLSNRVQVMFCNLPVCLPHIKAGRLTALGVSSARRSELLPQVPTIAESGLPGYEVDGWFGLFAPAGTPDPIVARLNAEMTRILDTAEVRQLLLAQGATAEPGTQQEFARFVQSEHDKWARVIKQAGITLE
ncbi:tripartite tricarboxylate transporter substrate binding protein [Bordetella petrii]|uniref:tripartite tricarboxylate transporter substrate binding protein n=1 Tax=Bordetella petrii TaxID=94624 RepID=UPI001A9766C4|nr:tripartite tricarboxylate transporter substrate binding protein [Bordetella petrii]MBO1114485.1 tripartite tricarboxylate transporter substrate binding protein [Bordetella petrii]